jgi:hypothetical protein
MKKWAIGILIIIILFCIIIEYYFSNMNLLEGMGSTDRNESYRYYPDILNEAIYKRIKVNYLLKETVEACMFLKKHKSLTHLKPPAVVPLEKEEKEEPYVDDTPEGDVSVDQLKNESMSNMSPVEFSDEYSKDIIKSDIYKKYQAFSSDINTELNREFGEAFDSDRLIEDSESILKKFQNSISYFDNAYNYTKYYVVMPFKTRKYVDKEFSLYYMNLIRKHIKSQVSLDGIKDSFFKLIKSSYIFMKMCQYYKDNIKVYNSKDDALFIVNTAIGTLKNAKYTDLHVKDDIVYSLKDDTDDKSNSVLSLDAIKFTDIAIVTYNIVLFIAYNINPHFGIPFNSFMLQYKKHMETKSIDSFYVFLMNNPPVTDRLT